MGLSPIWSDDEQKSRFIARELNALFAETKQWPKISALSN